MKSTASNPVLQLSSYQQKLLDPRWQKKRLEVFQRDNWACLRCYDDEETLHVHHRYYKKDCEPWEYPLEAFETLCAPCHAQQTQQYPGVERDFLQTLRMNGFDNLAYLRSLDDVFAILLKRYGAWWFVQILHEVGNLSTPELHDLIRGPGGREKKRQRIIVEAQDAEDSKYV